MRDIIRLSLFSVLVSCAVLPRLRPAADTGAAERDPPVLPGRLPGELLRRLAGRGGGAAMPAGARRHSVPGVQRGGGRGWRAEPRSLERIDGSAAGGFARSRRAIARRDRRGPGGVPGRLSALLPWRASGRRAGAGVP